MCPLCQIFGDYDKFQTVRHMERVMHKEDLNELDIAPRDLVERERITAAVLDSAKI